MPMQGRQNGRKNESGGGFWRLVRPSQRRITGLLDHNLITLDAALEAARIMRGYSKNKGPRERTAPDFLIGAHAIKQSDALLTTDAGFFRHYFEGLRVVVPDAWL